MTGSAQATRPTPDESVSEVPGLPRDAGGPVFHEPWEAQAFAVVVALQARGLFTWGEWAAALGEAITSAQRAGDPDAGDTYYRHWMAALETVLEHKGVTDRAALARLQRAWDRAARRTPHGTPIELAAEDFS